MLRYQSQNTTTMTQAEETTKASARDDFDNSDDEALDAELGGDLRDGGVHRAATQEWRDIRRSLAAWSVWLNALVAAIANDEMEHYGAEEDFADRLGAEEFVGPQPTEHTQTDGDAAAMYDPAGNCYHRPVAAFDNLWMAAVPRPGAPLVLHDHVHFVRLWLRGQALEWDTKKPLQMIGYLLHRALYGASVDGPTRDYVEMRASTKPPTDPDAAKNITERARMGRALHRWMDRTCRFVMRRLLTAATWNLLRMAYETSPLRRMAGTNRWDPAAAQTLVWAVVNEWWGQVRREPAWFPTSRRCSARPTYARSEATSFAAVLWGADGAVSSDDEAGPPEPLDPPLRTPRRKRARTPEADGGI
jgi:hypothetical protein